MGYGGPVWHVSIAYHGRLTPRPFNDEEERCHRALSGVGNADRGQWREVGERATHLRRRLSLFEATTWGVVVRDIRGTEEAEARLAPLRHLLPVGYEEI